MQKLKILTLCVTTSIARTEPKQKRQILFPVEQIPTKCKWAYHEYQQCANGFGTSLCEGTLNIYHSCCRGDLDGYDPDLDYDF